MGMPGWASKILLRVTMKRIILTGLLALALAGFPKPMHAQNAVSEALAAFPPQTLRLEYSSPARLRKFPNYDNLRQRYIGPRLQAMETSLAQLGVREQDIDELVLGWQPSKEEWGLYGFASGRFDVHGIAKGAADRGMSPPPVAGEQAYCLGAGLAGSCVVALGTSLGAFGSLGSLSKMLDARAGKAPGLSSDQRFSHLVAEATRNGAPIWGVAVGSAVGDWFRGWMPSQGSI